MWYIVFVYLCVYVFSEGAFRMWRGWHFVQAELYDKTTKLISSLQMNETQRGNEWYRNKHTTPSLWVRCRRPSWEAAEAVAAAGGLSGPVGEDVVE